MNSKKHAKDALKYLIVCHDAGGSEIISSWVKRHQENGYRFILAGPAVGIFKGKLRKVRNTPVSLMRKYVCDSDRVLTGTSWGSDIEKRAILIARENGVSVASFMDHWVNYPQRFILDGKEVLPNEIWVGDAEAFALAKKYFPKAMVRLVSNPYFKDIKKEIKAKDKRRRSKGSPLRILYLCEPIANHVRKEFGDDNYYGYTEFDAMRNFLHHLPGIAGKYKTREIRIRQHPAEPKGKYRELLKWHPSLRAVMSKGSSLVDDCLWADWIVGCESMALVIGLLASRKVFSVIPESGRACSLPHKNIVRLAIAPKEVKQ
ncbi:MAG: hypothetical protein PHX20_07965 [Candidatus Omnitrophica bacterium]|nr:hypothetical protein [Candidatus Omnitrophota bacterium]MDD5437460.1 hypothetical protein [Candidatus Omnitrophota bacterium]